MLWKYIRHTGRESRIPSGKAWHNISIVQWFPTFPAWRRRQQQRGSGNRFMRVHHFNKCSFCARAHACAHHFCGPHSEWATAGHWATDWESYQCVSYLIAAWPFCPILSPLCPFPPFLYFFHPRTILSWWLLLVFSLEILLSDKKEKLKQ